MEATLATKTSGRDLGMGPKETCLQQQFVGNNPPSGCWMSNPNPPAEPQTISISSCSAASYDHHLKRSEDSVISCETVNSSPMLFSHYPEPYQLQKSYPSGTPSEPSFSISLEPNHGLTEAFLPSNTHTQLLEQISNLTGQPFGAYAEYMVSDHDVQGSVDHIYSSQAAGLPLSEQSLISNWQNNKLGTGFTTLAWKSPHVSHSETNLPNICMASDEYTDQGFHLSVPRSSCNKRSNTSDSDEEMYHLGKKPTPWAFISTSADSKSSKLKPKAKKAGATDPQSVAARHRRERISERLKILQELIPNGSKVDLVTMLEKAISYVKFLQLQVKVLTTDEYWPTQDGSLPNIDKVKEALQVLTSTRSSVDTDGTSSSSSDLQKKQKSTTNTNNTKNDQNQKHASQ